MTVQSFDPSELSMTDSARSHVSEQLAKGKSEALFLTVSETGCNGYMYELSYTEEQPGDAREFDFGKGVRVYVANDIWNLIRGTEIDFVTEGLNSSLKFKNPNADTLCGCGESFSANGT